MTNHTRNPFTYLKHYALALFLEVTPHTFLHLEKSVLGQDDRSAVTQNKDAESVFTTEATDWSHNYKGSVLIQKYSIAFDNSGATLPTHANYQVNEFRLTHQGYEQIGLSWIPPFRDDLTPDVSYTREDPGTAVIVNGSSRGPRALVFPPKTKGPASLPAFKIISDLFGHLAGENVATVTRQLEWRRCNTPTITVSQDNSATLPAPIDVELDEFEAESKIPTQNMVELHAKMLKVTGTPPVEGTANQTASNQAKTWLPQSIDLVAKNVYGSHTEWNGTNRMAYRVIK